MNKIKKFLKGIRREEKAIALTAVWLYLVSPQAHADGAAAGGTGAAGMVSTLLGYIFGIFQYIGILLLAWGVGQLVLAFRNEDGDSKSRAIMLILSSIVLMSIGTIVSGLVNGQGGVNVSGEAKTF